MTHAARRLVQLLSARKFVYVVIAVFALQAIWLALTARYPGAFDENFHLGLIQIHAQHWLPFLSTQPLDGGVYGAVARDPSYLYHYLMSFPYRLLTLLTDSQTLQIIVLRLMNVALAVGSLLLYVRIMRRTRLTPLVQNVVMVLFTMIPVLPLLASQINYDNLLLLLTAWILLLAMRFSDGIKNGVFSSYVLLELLTVALLASLTKYAFLPIFAGIVLYLAILLFRQRHSIRWPRIERLDQVIKRGRVIGLAAVFVIAAALCVERYGVNFVRYHTPVPDCAQVITVEECLGYAPWQRDYYYRQDHTDWNRDHIGRYAIMWARQMVRELYFTIYGAFKPDGTVSYTTGEPLPFMIITGWTLFLSGTAAVAVCIRQLWRDHLMRLFLLTALPYVLILFWQNYQMYVETAVPVAIHGRYLLPLIPLLFILYMRSLRILIDVIKRRLPLPSLPRSAVVLTIWVVLLLAYSQGGGIITFIVRSDHNWYWPQSAAAQSANDGLRSLLGPIVVEKKL